MYLFPQNAIIVGEYVDDWFTLKADVPCIVITRNEGIVFKLVTNIIIEERSLVLKSLNPAYKPYSAPVSEVCEIWKYHSYISNEMPQADLFLEDIAKTMRAMHSDVKVLMGKV